MPDILNLATRPEIEPIDSRIDVALNQVMGQGAPKINTDLLGGITIDMNTGGSQNPYIQQGFDINRLKNVAGYNEFDSSYAKEFDPEATDIQNTRAYANRQPLSEWWANAAIKGGSTAWNSFLDGWKQNGRNFEALAAWDANKLYNPENNLDQMEEDRYKYPTFGRGELDNAGLSKFAPWNLRSSDFYGEMLPQLGFTIGTMGQAILENMAIAWATGGIGNLANSGKNAWTAAQLGKGFTNLFEAANGIKNLKKGLTALSSIQKEQGLLQGFGNIGKALANGYAMFNTAAAEGSFEASHVLAETKQHLIDKFVDEKGYQPFGQELEKIENIAQKAAISTFGWNLPILLTSNLIQFGNIIKPYKPITSLASTLDDVALKATKAGVEIAEQSKWLRYGKSFGRFFLEGASEGLEESSQALVSNTSSKYYEYLADAIDPRTALNTALSEGFDYVTSKNGFDEFMGGFLGGTMFKGIGAIADKTGLKSKLLGTTSKKDKESIREMGLKILNETTAEDILRYVQNPDVENYIKQLGLSKEMQEASILNDKIRFDDAKFESIRSFIYAGLQTGKLDVKLSTLELLKEMTDEEIAKEYNISVEDKEEINKKRVEINEYVNNINNTARNMQEDFKAVEQKYGNRFDPIKQYDNFQAWEQAKKTRVFTRNIAETSKLASNKLINDITSKTEGRIHSRMFNVILDQNLRADYINDTLLPYTKVDEKDQTPAIKNKIKEYEIFVQIDEMLKKGEIDYNQIAQTLFNLVENHPNDLTDFVDSASTQMLIKDIEETLLYEAKNRDAITAYNYLNGKGFNDLYEQNLKAQKELGKKPAEIVTETSPVINTPTDTKPVESPNLGKEVDYAELSPEEFVNQVNSQLQADFIPRIGIDQENFQVKQYVNNKGVTKAATKKLTREQALQILEDLFQDETNFSKKEKASKPDINNDNLNKPVEEIDTLLNKMKDLEGKNKPTEVYPISTSSLNWENRNDSSLQEERDWMTRTQYFYDNLLYKKLKRELNQVLAIPVTDSNIRAVEEKLGLKNKELEFMLNSEYLFSNNPLSGHINYLYVNKTKEGQYELLDQDGNEVKDDFKNRIVRSRHVDRKIDKNNPYQNQTDKLRGWSEMTDAQKDELVKNVENFGNKLSAHLVKQGNEFLEMPFAVSQGIQNISYDKGKIQYSSDVKTTPTILFTPEEIGKNVFIDVYTGKDDFIKDERTQTFLISGRPYLRIEQAKFDNKNSGSVEGRTYFYLDNFKLNDNQKKKVKESLLQILESGNLDESPESKYVSGVINAKIGNNKSSAIDSKYQISIYREKGKADGKIKLTYYDFQQKKQLMPDASFVLENQQILDELLEQLYHKVDNNLLKNKKPFTDLSTGETFPSYTHYLIGHKDAPLSIRLSPKVTEDNTELARIQKYSVIDYSAIEEQYKPNYVERKQMPKFIFRKQADAKPQPKKEEAPVSQTKATPVKAGGMERPKFGDFLMGMNGVVENTDKNGKVINPPMYTENGVTIREALIWSHLNQIRTDKNIEKIRIDEFDNSSWELFIDLFVTKNNKSLQQAYKNNPSYNTLKNFEQYLKNLFSPYVAGVQKQNTNIINQTGGSIQPVKNKFNKSSDLIGKTMSDGKVSFVVESLTTKGTGVNTTKGVYTWAALNSFDVVGEQSEDAPIPFIMEEEEGQQDEYIPTPEEEAAAFNTVEVTPEDDSKEVKNDVTNKLSEEEEKQIEDDFDSLDDFEENNTKLESDETEPLTQQELDELNKMVKLKGLELVNQERMLGDRRVWGTYKDGVIKLYVGAKKGTAYHEAFELVYNGILTKKQQDKIYEDFKKREGEFKTYLGETKLYSEATQKEAKETMADEFIDFKQKDLARPEVRNIFQRMWNFIKSFIKRFIVSKKFLRENSTPTIDVIYQDLAKGYYKDVQVRNTLEEYFSISDVPVSFTQDFALTATNKLFNEFIKNDNGRNLLSELEEGTVSEAEFFKSFKDNIDGYFGKDRTLIRQNMQLYKNYLESKRAKELKISVSNLSNEEKAKIKDKVIESGKRGQNIYKNLIVEDYENFKNVMKTLIQSTMSLSFEEAQDNQDEEWRSQAEKSEGEDAKTYDYVPDKLKFDNFKSVSATIKLMIGSIVDATYIESTNKVQPVISDVTMMEKSGTYYKLLFNKFMNYLVDVNDPQAIKAKIENLIFKVKEDNTLTTSAPFVIFKAQLKQYYDMIYGDGQVTSQGQLKLQARHINAFQKQKPTAYRLKSEVDTENGTDITFIQDDAFETIARSYSQKIGKGIRNTKFTTKIANKPGYLFSDTGFITDNLLDKPNLIKAFSYLGIEFDMGFLDLLNNKEIDELITEYKGIVSTIKDYAKNKTPILEKNNNISALPFWGRINAISNIYAKYHRDDTDIMRINPEGNAQNTIIDNNFLSLLVSDAFTSKDWDEFISKNPHLRFAYADNSILLDRMRDLIATPIFERNKKDFPILSILSGEETDNSGKTTDKFNEAELFKARFNFSFDVKGRKAAFPIYENADSSTDYYLQTGQYFDMSDVFADKTHLGVFKNYLKSEIQAAIDFKSDVKNLNTDVTITTIDGKEITRQSGTSLGFATTYLPYDALEKLYKSIDNARKLGGVKIDSVISSLKEYDVYIENYINKEVEKEYQEMKSLGYVKENGKVVTTYMIDKDILFTNLSTSNPSIEQFKKLLKMRQINSFAHVNELSKVFFGRVNNMKSIEDALKRYKNFMSPRNTTLSDENFNNNANIILNKRVVKVRKGETDYDVIVNLKKGDVGYTNFREEFNTVFSSDYNTMNKVLAQLHKKEGKYNNIKSSDGQSYATLDFIREILWKSGGKFYNVQEHSFQVLKSYERLKLNNLGNPYSQSERTRDEEILQPYKKGDKYNLDDVLKSVSIIKPIHSGVILDSEEHSNILIKTSTLPLSLYLVEGTQLENIYVSMLKNDKQVLAFPSATKIGEPIGVNNIINSDGTIKDVSELKGYKLRTRDFGIQTETQNTKTTTTAGTQTMKILTSNLYDRGKPKDYSKSIEKWNSLSEQEKIAESAYYRAETKHREALKAVFNKNYEELLTKIGITYSGGRIVDVKENEITAYIKERILEHGVANNIVDHLDKDEDGNKVVPYEMMSDYTLIKSIIFSMVDKGIVSPKVNGSMKIQVSSAFFESKESKDFKILIKKDGKFVDTKKNQKINPEDEILITSPRLKFYEQVDGKTQRMQVMISSDMLRKVNERREKMNLSKLDKQELLEYLNSTEEGKRLLQGVGFRIPTQGMNSIDSFEIVDFLPDYMGDAIVVPSELPEKAGSDFDVDKLSVYFNNYTINRKGYPEYITFLTDENSTVEERFLKIIKSKERNLAVIYTEMKGSKEYLESGIDELLDANMRLIEGSEDLTTQAKEDAENIFSAGLYIFSELAIPIKQQFYEKEKELRTDDITGAEKTLEYIKYTNNWIKEFESTNGLILPYENRKGETQEIEIMSKDVLPIFNNMIDNYNEYLEALGITKELIQEYLEIKDERLQQNREAVLNFRKRINDVVAEHYNIPVLSDFRNLSIYEQNSKKAVENNYFEAMDEIMLLEENFKRITKPNNSARAEKVAEKLAELKGIKNETEQRRFNLNKLVSPIDALKNRIGFLEYKKLIGIAAVGVTSHANMQKGLYVSTENIPHSNLFKTNKVKLKDKDGVQREYNTISSVENVESEDIMDTIGMFVDGTVDVVKKPWLVSFGADKIRFGATIMGIKFGMSLDDIGYVISSPFVEEYSRVRKIMSNSVSKINPDFKELKSKTYEGWESYFEKQYNIVRKGTPTSLSKNKLDEIVKKVYKNGQFSPEALSSLNQDEINIAFVMLDVFQFMEKHASNLRQIVSTSNHETTHLKDNTTVEVKESTRRMLEETALFDVYENGAFTNPVDYLRKSTFVEPIIYNLNQFVNDVVYKHILLPGMKNITDRVIKEMSKDDTIETFAEAVQRYNKSMEIAALSNFLFDSKIIGPSSSKGNRIVDNLDAYTKIDRKNGNSLYNFLQSAKSYASRMDDSAKILTGMSVFEYIDISDEANNERYYLKIKGRPSGTEIVPSNTLFAAFETLRSNTDKVPNTPYTYRDLYNVIMMNSIMRNGMGFSKHSLLTYINKEDYRELAKNINNLSVDDEFYDKIRRNAIQNEYNKLDNVISLNQKNPFFGAFENISDDIKEINSKFVNTLQGIKLGRYQTKSGKWINNKLKDYLPENSWNKGFILMKDESEITNKEKTESKKFRTAVSKKSAFYRIEKTPTGFQTMLWIKQPYYIDIQGVRTSIYIPQAIKGTQQTKEYQSSHISELNPNPEANWTKESVIAKLIDLGYIENEQELLDERYSEDEGQIPFVSVSQEKVVSSQPIENTNLSIESNTISPKGKPSIDPTC